MDPVPVYQSLFLRPCQVLGTSASSSPRRSPARPIRSKESFVFPLLLRGSLSLDYVADTMSAATFSSPRLRRPVKQHQQVLRNLCCRTCRTEVDIRARSFSSADPPANLLQARCFYFNSRDNHLQ